MNNKDKHNLLIFQRRIVRKIVGPVQVNVQWGIRTSLELEKSLREKNIFRYIKSYLLSWLGHIKRMRDNKGIKVILNCTFSRTRFVGRPKKRWKDCVLEDLKGMKIDNWRTKARCRATWKKIVQQVRAYTGCKTKKEAIRYSETISDALK